VAMAKLNKPINASAAESALVKTDWTYMPITNCSEGLCTKKISLSKFYPFTVSTFPSVFDPNSIINSCEYKVYTRIERDNDQHKSPHSHINHRMVPTDALQNRHPRFYVSTSVLLTKRPP
jgi:hypothetical protein